MSSEVCVACGFRGFLVTPTLLEGVSLVRCGECGVATTYPKPSPDGLDQNYSEAYYGPENVKFIPVAERIIEWITNSRARWLHNQISPHSRILDIGCGRGLLLKALAQLGHECHGTERSELAATQARRIVEIKIYTKPLDECAFPENYFDLVILWHVLEHLEDPVGPLRQTSSLLKPKGILVLEVPNLSSIQSSLTGRNWFHLDIERHLYHFTPQGLSKLLECQRFVVKTIKTFSIEQCPFGALQSFMNLLGPDAQVFYRLLKREVMLPWPWKLYHCALAALFLGPATLFAYLEFLMSRGGVIRTVSQKKAN